MLIAIISLFTNDALACGGKDCGSSCSMAEHAAAGGAATIPADVQGTRVTLDVSGMKCATCSGKVTAALTAVDGVKAVAVDHATGKAEVVFDEKKTNADALAKVVTDLGYSSKVAVAAK